MVLKTLKIDFCMVFQHQLEEKSILASHKTTLGFYDDFRNLLPSEDLTCFQGMRYPRNNLRKERANRKSVPTLSLQDGFWCRAGLPFSFFEKTTKTGGIKNGNAGRGSPQRSAGR